MTEIIKPAALLCWSLYVNCPHCEHQIDLSDIDYDSAVATALFNNRWDELKGHEVACPSCKREFEIAGVEY